MSNIEALKRRRSEPVLAGWAGYVAEGLWNQSVASAHRLIDDLIGLGSDPKEADVKAAVDRCVVRFNELDDGWICTIEREDLFELICEVVGLAGFECDEDWVDEREW